MSNEGMKVSVHYVGTLDDGSVFDSSRARNQPLDFVCMAGQMIPGFDAAVRDMEVGEIKKVHLEPSEAYGDYKEELVVEVPLPLLPGANELEEGHMVMLYNPQGVPTPALVVEKNDRVVIFDTNHLMAGKALNFEIELLDVSEYEGGCAGCAGCGEGDCGDCGDGGCDSCEGCGC